jgi:hypothetical protein
MNFTLMSEMPSFFTDVLGFDLRSAGALCVLPYFAMFVAAIGFGKLFEYWERECGWSVCSVRRSAQFVAYFCSGVVLLMCAYVSSTMGAYTLMIFTLVLLLLQCCVSFPLFFCCFFRMLCFESTFFDSLTDVL